MRQAGVHFLDFSRVVLIRALAGPIKSTFRSSFVVGNLVREEARTYFFDYVLPFRKHRTLDEQTWARVYEVCGGNPGLLQNCANEATARGSWAKGAACSPHKLRSRVSS